MRNDELIDDWLSLDGRDARILAIGDPKLRAEVQQGYENDWSDTLLRSKETKLALSSALEEGNPLPNNIRKELNATLRATDDRYGLSKSTNKLRQGLRGWPHLVVLLYASYGGEALRSWPQVRKANKARQKRWNQSREKQAAKLCDKIYKGLPSHQVLAKSEEPELRSLSHHLRARGAIDAFAEKYGLNRVLDRSSIDWSIKDNIQLLLETYANICLRKARFIPDCELSMLNEKIEISLHNVIASNTLRYYLKKYVAPIKEIFLDLVKLGTLPIEWKVQVKMAIANDGTILDSWTEVRWYEMYLKILIELPLDDPLKSMPVCIHPKIGNSTLKSDFLIGGKVYVEVLRHPMNRINTPITKDQKHYARQLNKRINEYKKQKLEYFCIDSEQMSDYVYVNWHFSEIIRGASGCRTVLPKGVKVHEGYPSGYWYQEKHRDEAALHTVRELDPDGRRSGIYPSHSQLIAMGYGGLVSYQKRMSRHMGLDRQTEAVRSHTFATGCSTHKTSSLRKPVREEMLDVLKWHHKVYYGQKRIPFSRKQLLHVFGGKVLEWLYEEFGDCDQLAAAMGFAPLSVYSQKFSDLEAAA